MVLDFRKLVQNYMKGFMGKFDIVQKCIKMILIIIFKGCSIVSERFIIVLLYDV